jgi:hypothetical protein
MRGSVTNNNGFWIGWLHLLTLLRLTSLLFTINYSANANLPTWQITRTCFILFLVLSTDLSYCSAYCCTHYPTGSNKPSKIPTRNEIASRLTTRFGRTTRRYIPPLWEPQILHSILNRNADFSGFFHEWQSGQVSKLGKEKFITQILRICNSGFISFILSNLVKEFLEQLSSTILYCSPLRLRDWK